MSAFTLDLNAVDLIDDQYYQLCQNNREVRFERTAKGALIIMSPVGGDGGNQEAGLITDVGLWNRRAGEPGLVFSSSTGFKLPS